MPRKRKHNPLKGVSTPFHKCYIPLQEDESFEWRWEERKICEIDDMWKMGFSPYLIADLLKRDPDEVLVLLICRARSGIIKQRAGGLMGTINEIEEEQRDDCTG